MTDSPVKRVRRKALTESGRALLNQQRQKLNREQAALGERLVNEARAAQQFQQYVDMRYKPTFNAVSRGILRRVAGVLASEGVTPAIEVHEGSFAAYTDFDSITVSYPADAEEDVRLTAATLRGLLYHEGGHIRWTTPYLNMLKEAKAAFPEYEWEKLILDAGGGGLHNSRFHHAWNALEDQRMETAVVSDSPRKAMYFTPVILKHLAANPMEAAANYPLLIWRRYLPRHVRAASRQAFIAFHDAVGDVDGLGLARAFEQVITNYVTADNAKDMFIAVLAMVKLLELHTPAFDLGDAGHGGLDNNGRRGNGGGNKTVVSIPISPDMLDDDVDKGEGEDGEGQPTEAGTPVSGEQGKGTAAEKGKGKKVIATQPMPSDGASKAESEASDGQGKGKGEGDKSESDADGGDGESEGDEPGDGAGSEAGTHDTEKDFQDALKEAIQDAEAARDSDRALDGDEDAFRQAIDNSHSKLPVYVGGRSKDNARSGKAEAVSQQIEDAFMEATMDRMPGWLQQQRRGILDVNRWEMRAPGNVDVFRQFNEDDAPGYNLAVSILLDYSGSMGHAVGDLAMAAYASKLACQRLGIPCTVTLWDTSAATLWDGTEQAAGLPIINTAGGTNPSVALGDLDNQRFDKDQHLVMVMTDGLWDGEWHKQTISAFNRPGRRFIGFGYGVDEKNLNRLGFKDAFQITDLMVIPKVLERILPEMA